MICPGDLITDTYLSLRGFERRLTLGRQEIGLVIAVVIRQGDNEAFVLLPSGEVGRVFSFVLGSMQAALVGRGCNLPPT